MNKSGLSIMEYKRNAECNADNSVVTYAGCTFITGDVDFKAGVVDLYSTIGADQPCHSSIEIELVEFV